MPVTKDRLTLKQAKWLSVYIQTGNATEAAMQAYNVKNREYAAQIGWENVRKLDIQGLMEEMGLTDVALLNAAAEGLTKSMKVTPTGESFVETEDYATRHRYLETLLKLKKRLGSDSSTTNIGISIAVRRE